MTSSDVWTAEQAQRYDGSDGMFSADVVGPTVEALAALAGDGSALEFAIGTGRIGVPLRAKGVPVTGIELSAPMVDQLRTKISQEELPVTIGDMATTQVEGEFALVFLVFNTIGNLRTQAEQVECFRNAARHLVGGGALRRGGRCAAAPSASAGAGGRAVRRVRRAPGLRHH